MNTELSTDPFSEEVARAELYGLLASLWLAPPDAGMLDQFRVAVTQAPETGSALEAPWQALVARMRAATVESAAAEFAALFQGVGKPEVFPYASFFLAGFVNEKPLAQLRTDLAAIGLTRDAALLETEDHVSFLFEVMRYLIAGDDAGVSNLEQQRRFFRAHIQPWIEALCKAVDAQPAADLWRAVAAMTLAFVQVETQAFDLLEA
ncbi:molecular chaperone TorD family protein [Variovorax dokdonensis]|uniref:Molecular chaperone TorD family protein n=1 Tax=Variovorax dokdonensis TaxID=344883 RepID=A0ABT7NA72_9BURK|nr:molecular chaperone TorD family protein [Variovorax dokdonensis]